MSKWNAPSDRDYADEVESAQAPTEYDVTCLICDAHFSVRADDRPPYICEGCQARSIAPARERTAR